VLLFDEPTHRYTLDGVAVPSVTQVLRAGGLFDAFDRLPEGVRLGALERGRLVHQALHYLNEQDLDLVQFARDFPELQGYVQGWIDFCAQRAFVPMLCEYRLASRRHQLAGTADCFGELDGHGALVDFATGGAPIGKDLQTSAYLSMAYEASLEDARLAQYLDTHPVVKRFAVLLRKDGGFQIHQYADPGDFRRFLLLHQVTA